MQTEEDGKLKLYKNKAKACEYMMIKLQKELQMYNSNPNLNSYQLMWQKVYNMLPDIVSQIRVERVKDTFQRLNFIELLTKVEPDFEMPKVNANDLDIIVKKGELTTEILVMDKAKQIKRLTVHISHQIDNDDPIVSIYQKNDEG